MSGCCRTNSLFRYANIVSKSLKQNKTIFITPDDAVDRRKLEFLTLSFYSSLRSQLKFSFIAKEILRRRPFEVVSVTQKDKRI